MKEIVSDFISGSATEKLAIISNISTILGVSVVTFVAGPFLSEFAGKEFIVSDFIISVIFYFLCLWGLLALIYNALKEMYKFGKEKKYAKATSEGLVLLFVIWIGIVSFPYVKHFVGDTFNVSYLLAQHASKAIKKVEGVNQEKTGEILTISGRVSLGEGVKGSDYELLLYSKSKSGIYNPVILTNFEYVFELSGSGKFVLPVDMERKYLSDAHLIIFRSSDWSLIRRSTNRSGYPESVTSMPNKSIEDLGAFIYRIET
ncbi:Uncharacterised protein [BD1-7 clade bacterium]|uniref:Uncharacterized protein n=1 Tax=BD1-7 clade bacterium TaxID=2029982 RepID=A0A5S9NQM9_9GAMM|nr:Uncharacterised protein [BD1-7 clade bacterium]